MMQESIIDGTGSNMLMRQNNIVYEAEISLSPSIIHPVVKDTHCAQRGRAKHLFHYEKGWPTHSTSPVSGSTALLQLTWQHLFCDAKLSSSVKTKTQSPKPLGDGER